MLKTDGSLHHHGEVDWLTKFRTDKGKGFNHKWQVISISDFGNERWILHWRRSSKHSNIFSSVQNFSKNLVTITRLKSVFDLKVLQLHYMQNLLCSCKIIQKCCLCKTLPCQPFIKKLSHDLFDVFARHIIITRVSSDRPPNTMEEGK